MMDCPKKELGQITTTINGLWTGKKPPFINIAVIRNTNFSKDCRLKMDDVAMIDVEVKQFASRKLQMGDIIIEKSGGSDKQPVGRPVLFNIPEGDYSFSNFTSTLRVNDQGVILPEYLHKFLYKFYLTGKTAEMQSKTTGLRNLDFNAYKAIKVPVPSIEEQQRIVDELNLLTSIIDKKNAQLRDLDALTQSIFYEMFGDPVINERKWPVKTLNSVCDVRDGTHDSPKYLLQSDYILITSKNINGDSIDFSNINYISKDDYDAINRRSKVDEGDIIMAMIGTIGKPVIVKDTGYKFCVKNVALIKFPVQSEVSNIYIRALLNSPSYSDYIMSLNKGGTQKFVPLGTLRGLPIPVPSATALQEFAERLSIVESQSKLIRQSILELNKLLDSRMNHYFV